ncbi:hypothetical protein Dimus_005606 [Dionaea muscipula]
MNIELDGMTFVTILGIPGNWGLCDYIKEVWEEGKYCKPLEITRKFSNDQLIMEVGRVSPNVMRPFQRMLHIFVMKNLLPRFGKRDIASFMDLTYMEYLTAKLPINLPRLMIRHMSYMISVPQHERPYSELLTRVFEAFEVPLNDKEGDEPKRYEFFEDTFLSMSQLKRENDVWWLGIGADRFDCLEATVEGEQTEKVVEVEDTGSGEKFYDVVDEERIANVDVTAQEVIVPAPAAQTSVQQKKNPDSGVDPSGPSGSILESDFQRLQAELDRAHEENSRLQALLQQATPQPKP